VEVFDMQVASNGLNKKAAFPSIGKLVNEWGSIYNILKGVAVLKGYSVKYVVDEFGKVGPKCDIKSKGVLSLDACKAVQLILSKNDIDISVNYELVHQNYLLRSKYDEIVQIVPAMELNEYYVRHIIYAFDGLPNVIANLSKLVGISQSKLQLDFGLLGVVLAAKEGSKGWEKNIWILRQWLNSNNVTLSTDLMLLYKNKYLKTNGEVGSISTFIKETKKVDELDSSLEELSSKTMKFSDCIDYLADFINVAPNSEYAMSQVMYEIMKGCKDKQLNKS
jgi:hypothetical protein